MKQPSYVPDAGDIIWMTFDPQVGREQRGRRPSLVLTPRAYNARRGLAVVCPITSKIKGHSFEVLLPEDSDITGAVLFDHLRSVDWRERDVRFAQAAPATVVSEVRERLKPLLGV